MEFFLLLLSIPFFYIWGLISFIKFVTRSGKPSEISTDRKSLLLLLLTELKKMSPDKRISSLIEDYEKELKKLQQTDKVPVISASTMPASATIETKPETKVENEVKPVPTQAVQSAPSFQNWYKDNSINLLLYIGAFLIVVSATIYVGLDAVTGVSKGVVLSAVTLLFFFAGLWFYTMPKVKNAGSAFAAIGSLLIPITGLGWYNFVFKFTDVPMGAVWLVTTIVGLFAYIVLARYFKSAFYSYVSSFSTLSFSFAMVNVQGLENDFYILAGIMSSILLLGVSIYFHQNKNESTEIFAQPFSLTANVVMPASILYGMILISEGSLFTLQSTLSVLLGSVFYFMSYVYFKKSWYMLAVLVLFTLTLIYFGNWQQFSTLNILHLITASAYLDIYITYYFQKKLKTDEANYATALSILKNVLIYVMASGSEIESFQLLFFAVIPVIVGILFSLLRKNVWYISLSAVFLAISMYLCVYELTDFSGIRYIPERPALLGILYALTGLGWYYACFRYKKVEAALIVFGYSCFLYFGFATFLFSDNWGYQMVNALVISLLSYISYKLFAKREFLYAGSIAFSFTIWCFSQFLELQNKPYILGTLYAIVGTAWYYACIKYKHRQDFLQSFSFASCANFILSFIILFTSQYVGYQLLLTVIVAGVLLSAAIEFAKKDLLYLSNSFFVLSLWNLLRYLNVDISLYPLAFITLSYAFYLLSTILSGSYRDIYRTSGLVAAIGTAIVFGVYSFDSDTYHSKKNLELYSLVSAYATFILYGLDAYQRNSSKIGYTTSAIGLVTYMWQIHYLGITDTQYYTLAVGFYFFGLSYLQRKKTDQNLKQTFDIIGTFFLLVPSWILSFGENGLTHALLLGMCGVLLLAFGITYTEKWYRYSGILAIVLAVMSQSKWAIIGIAGFGFLGLALYLLIFRKEDDHSSKKIS